MAHPPQLTRTWLRIAAFSGASAVGLGAFGSHGLRHVVSPDLLQVWKTAVEYQLFHTLALLALSVGNAGHKCLWPLRLWTAGIVLFSGSLYILVLTGITKLGMVTPVGGICFIAGWLALVCTSWPRGEAKES